jgi:hypothetical protein
MKIAVCISGQWRTGDACSKNVLNFFTSNKNIEVDFFIHTWDKNDWISINQSHQIKNSEGHVFGVWYDNSVTDLTELNITNIKKSYNPKYIKVESFNDFESMLRKRKYIPPNSTYNDITGGFNALSLFYSFYRSITLKKLYEKKHNIKYDFVFKIRPDIIFENNSNIDEHIEILKTNGSKSLISYFNYNETESHNWKNILQSNWGPDLYWGFDNNTSELFSEYFNKKLIFDKKNINDVEYKNGYTQFLHTYLSNLTPINSPSKCYIIRELYESYIPYLENEFASKNLSILYDFFYSNSYEIPNNKFLDYLIITGHFDDMDKKRISLKNLQPKFFKKRGMDFNIEINKIKNEILKKLL